jgi:hypothetical protein
MTPNWRVHDLIDLEYFLSADNTGEDAADEHRRRDRRIYKNVIHPHLSENGDDRRVIIKQWLETRQADSGSRDLPLPGESFQQAARLLIMLTIGMGGAAGAAAALSALLYTGNTPVNVSVFLFIFVFLQILLAAGTLVLMVSRPWRGRRDRRGVILKLIGLLLVTVTGKLRESAWKRLPANHRQAFQAAMGIIRGKQQIYGSVFIWPLFTLTQLFAVCVNVGILTATLLRVVGADLAFGWQSTLQISPQAVHRLTAIMAAPWRWIVPPELAYPSVAQIEGSRMMLKNGIYHLTTPDLVSWWPFLCLAVLVYGLMPRLLLMVTGVMARRKALARIDFHTAACDRLMFRLTTPIVSTGGLPVQAVRQSLPAAPWPAPPAAQEEDNGTVIPPAGAVILVPGDLTGQCPREELFDRVARKTGTTPARSLSYGTDLTENRDTLADLARTCWEDGRPNLIIVQEAWQAPIKEILMFIRQSRQVLGPAAAIRIGLIGKPTPETIFTDVAPENRDLWTRALQQLGDPALSVDELGGKP